MGVNTSSKDVLIDGTLFKSEFLSDRAQYRVTSRTPVEDNQPLELVEWVERAEATKYRDGKWIQGHSVDSAAMAIGIERLQARIPGEIRKMPVSSRVREQMEDIEGFGSF
jgi:hypothetical protein